jgi:hypothetical protein
VHNIVQRLRLYEQQSKHGKYDITLFAMFKNEKHALRQWVIHHLAQGVNHLLLVDNNSPRSAESCELEEFISAGIVALVGEPALDISSKTAEAGQPAHASLSSANSMGLESGL